MKDITYRDSIFAYLILFCLIIHHHTVSAQVAPQARITDWSKAGLQDSVPVYSNVVNIMNYGGNNTGLIPNDLAFLTALLALNNHAGTIFFPAGSYLFNQTISLPDSTIIKGNGKDQTKLLFDLNGSAQNMIDIRGTKGSVVWNINQPILKNDTTLFLSNTNNLNTGDWIQLYCNDNNLITSSWATNTVGQVVQIKKITGTDITVDAPIRRSYSSTSVPQFVKLTPVKGAGIECLYIERVDSTAQQTSNISFTNAVYCWTIGIESNQTNFAHIELTRSAHILVRGNYFHHAHGYGGNGQAYGVAAQYTSGDCLIENNIFEHLRHSMLLQAGANGNVFGYNYSIDPYWNEPPLPVNAAGDAVLHGNYPYLNLFEGNILQNIVVDNSHGINGPFNTFFRNAALLYGIYQNTNPATDSMNYIGNEITNNGPLMGNYSLTGTGHFEYGNNKLGTLIPAGSFNLHEYSLYLAQPPRFWQANIPWPNIGVPYPFDTANSPARTRYTTAKTDCTANPGYIGLPAEIKPMTYNKDVTVYPNPATETLTLQLPVNSMYTNGDLSITDMLGRQVFSKHISSERMQFCVSMWAKGIYIIKLSGKAGTVYTGKIVVQ